jgi:hypothetical protein
LGGGGCGVDSPVSGYGPLVGCCECGDEPSGSGATELVVPSAHVEKRTAYRDTLAAASNCTVCVCVSTGNT